MTPTALALGLYLSIFAVFILAFIVEVGGPLRNGRQMVAVLACGALWPLTILVAFALVVRSELAKRA